MKDRISTEVLANGAIRYAEYDSSGNLVGYKYFKPADEPSENGTPINKASMLQDVTATLFGMDGNAVPNDVFSWLGRFNEYTWKRRRYGAAYWIAEKSVQTTSVVLAYQPYSGGSNVWKYSATVTPAQIPIVDNPTNITITFQATTESVAALRGKYFYTDEEVTLGYDTNKRWYADDDAYVTIDNVGGYPEVRLNNVRIVTSRLIDPQYGEYELLFSTDRDAYPDSGIHDGYEYEYLGVPFNKLPTAPQIETGSYVGTGTYGSANETSITLSFKPHLFFVFATPRNMSGLAYEMILNTADNQTPSQYSSFAITSTRPYDVYSRIVGNTVRWYATNDNYQMNSSGITYKWVAIG